MKEQQGTITASELAELDAGRDRLATARATDTDYLDLMTQNGFSMEHNVSVNGGNEKLNFMYPVLS